LASTLLLSSCDKQAETYPSIAGIAVANSDFSMLEDAAIRGGVVATLSNKNPKDAQGNYTVFAPTNGAFARLGLTQATDLAVLNRQFLTSTLLYHVGDGAVAGSDLQPGLAMPSVLGPNRRIILRQGQRYINGSRILSTDVRASNGTVHAIDKVLLATGVDIVASAVALSQGDVFVQPELTFLVEAVLHAGLAGTLSGPGPFTVFAPTDQAFRNLLAQLQVQPASPAGYVPADVRKLPVNTVRTVLLQHAIPGALFTSELPESASTASAAPGKRVTFGPFTDGVLTVRADNNQTPANMVIPDVQCSNGVVHVIDQVLLP
jgi:uncharacterized surface protein with fasciclin (FAS1) repeats